MGNDVNHAYRGDDPRVSVIIPNYNGMEYLNDCLGSLMAQHWWGFEVIVVDDGSTDGSLDVARAAYPGPLLTPGEDIWEETKERDAGALPSLRYLSRPQNLGFARSVNDGIAVSRAPYVLLLNNDTLVDPDFVSALYRSLRRRPERFSASAQMRQMGARDRMDDAGDSYCALGWAYAPAKDRPVAKWQRPRRVFAACAGAAIYRKDVLQELGGFDDAHFAYLEDIDLGYRARLHGYENVYCPAAVVYHAGSGSSGSRYNAFKIRLSSRNNVYLVYKNMPGWQIALNAPLLAVGFAIKSVFFARMGYGRLYLRGLLEGVRMCRAHRGRRVDFSGIPARRIWRIEAELLGSTIRRFLG